MIYFDILYGMGQHIHTDAHRLDVSLNCKHRILSRGPFFIRNVEVCCVVVLCCCVVLCVFLCTSVNAFRFKSASTLFS